MSANTGVAPAIMIASAVYAADNLPSFVENVGLNALRAEIGKMELDQVFSERQVLNQRVAKCISMGIFQPLHFGRCGLPLPVQRGRCATRHRRRALPAL